MRKTMTGITNPTEEYFKDGLWGWDGTQWRKAGLPLWYREPYQESLGGTASGTVYSKYSTPVPDGYVYVITNISIRNTTRAPGRTEIIVYDATHQILQIAATNSLDISIPLLYAGFLVFAPGYKLRVYMTATQDGDVIDGGVLGFKVAVT